MEKNIGSAAAFLRIHYALGRLLRVISSNRRINVDEFERLLRELYLDIVRSFPWCRISESVHFFLGHGGMLVRRNGGFGLMTLSEQGSEGESS